LPGRRSRQDVAEGVSFAQTDGQAEPVQRHAELGEVGTGRAGLARQPAAAFERGAGAAQFAHLVDRGAAGGDGFVVDHEAPSIVSE